MIAGDDPEPWVLLYDGTVVAIEVDGDTTIVSIEVPYLATRFAILRLRLAQVTQLCYLPDSDRWDEPEVTDFAAIVAAAPTIASARYTRHGELIVRGAHGRLIASYAGATIELGTQEPISLAELRRAVRAHWDEWRAQWQPSESTHPLVRDAMTGAWSHSRLLPLIEAWTTARTSDLAAVIDVLDTATRENPPVRLLELGAFDAWRDSWATNPGAAIAELAACAQRTFDLRDAHGDLDASTSECATWWAAITCALATLEAASPDPRLGRGLEQLLMSPSDNWFRVDQVAHVVASFAPPNDEPSFADRFFTLMATHADAGTAARLEQLARLISIEADCNGAEMAQRLRECATVLHARYPTDRVLADDALAALRNRVVQPSE